MRPDYSRDSELAKWGSGVSLHGSNPEPFMSALGLGRAKTRTGWSISLSSGRRIRLLLVLAMPSLRSSAAECP
jgi:hypothetical protein